MRSILLIVALIVAALLVVLAIRYAPPASAGNVAGEAYVGADARDQAIVIIQSTTDVEGAIKAAVTG